MRANELRIGNLVTTAGVQVKAMAIDIMELENGSLEIEPIALTEEKLLEFGFEKIYNGSFVKDDFFGYLSKSEKGYDLIDYEGNSVNDNPISHVHQLQNLFFALTGEELQLKN